MLTPSLPPPGPFSSLFWLGAKNGQQQPIRKDYFYEVSLCSSWHGRYAALPSRAFLICEDIAHKITFLLLFGILRDTQDIPKNCCQTFRAVSCSRSSCVSLSISGSRRSRSRWTCCCRTAGTPSPTRSRQVRDGRSTCLVPSFPVVLM